VAAGVLVGGGGGLGWRRRLRGRSRWSPATAGTATSVGRWRGQGSWPVAGTVAGTAHGVGAGGDAGVGRRRLRGPQRRSAAGTGTGALVGGGYGGGRVGRWRRRRTRGRRSAAAAGDGAGAAELGNSGLPRRGRGLQFSRCGYHTHGNKYTPENQGGEAVLWRAVRTDLTPPPWRKVFRYTSSNG